MPPFGPDTPVRDVLHAAPQALAVLERHRLDYCCGAGRSLAEACRRVGADVGAVLTALEAAAADPVPARSGLVAEGLSLDALVGHVLDHHHVETRRAMATLPALAAKVATVHGAAHPELVRVREVVEALFHELAAHMTREEDMLFPYLRALVAAERAGARPARPSFETAARPIHVMRMDHEAAGALLVELAELTGGYAPPADACGSWRALYDGLEAHNKDLMRHMWVENEQLFPKALELEARLLAK